MRYEDWDVQLIGLPNTQGPSPEFRTECYLVQDRDSAFENEYPLVETFTPSLNPGTPFCIAARHWGPVQISEHTRALQQRLGRDPSYHIRIRIDGITVSAQTVPVAAITLPVVMENISRLLARHGNDDTLRFPAFYEALLKSSHHPADNNGRIKVIIDEGFVQLSNPNSFDRVLTVVGFSWHHVPQGMLRFKLVAWPNAATRGRPFPRRPQPIPPPTAGVVVPEFSQYHCHIPYQHGQLEPPASAPPAGAAPVRPWVANQTFGPGNQTGFDPMGSSQPPFQIRRSTDPAWEMSPVGIAGDTNQLDLDVLGLGDQANFGAAMPSLGQHTREDKSMPDAPDEFDQLFASSGEPMHLSGPSLNEDQSDTPPLTESTSVSTGPDINNIMPEFDAPNDLITPLSDPQYIFGSTTGQPIQPASTEPQHVLVDPHLVPLPASEVQPRKRNGQLRDNYNNDDNYTGPIGAGSPPVTFSPADSFNLGNGTPVQRANFSNNHNYPGPADEASLAVVGGLRTVCPTEIFNLGNGAPAHQPIFYVPPALGPNYVVQAEGNPCPSFNFSGGDSSGATGPVSSNGRPRKSSAGGSNGRETSAAKSTTSRARKAAGSKINKKAPSASPASTIVSPDKASRDPRPRKRSRTGTPLAVPTVAAVASDVVDTIQEESNDTLSLDEDFGVRLLVGQ